MAEIPEPRPVELAAVLAAGAGHVLAELLLSETVAFLWSAVAAAGFGVYLARRARLAPGLPRGWGFRLDNLPQSLPPHLAFAAVGLAGLAGWAWGAGSLRLPTTLWLTLALYPLWGVAQQFALQHLVAGNLPRRLRPPLASAGIAALLFALSHVPRFDLVALTLAAGIPFILLYRAFPNLWAVGLAHGILGTGAAYLVLAKDPGAVILAWLR